MQEKWQQIVDLMAKIVGVPTGLIMKIDHHKLKYFYPVKPKGTLTRKGNEQILIPAFIVRR